MLTFNSRSVPSETIDIVPSKSREAVGANSRSKHNFRRSRDSGDSLRTQYHAEEIAPKSAIKKGKGNYKPPHVGEGDQGTNKQVDPESGMSWRDV